MFLRQFLRIVEIRTKIVSVSTFSIATLFTVYRTGEFSWLLFGLMAAAVLCVDMGTTAFNTFFDYDRGVDSLRHNRESDKVLVHEQTAPGVALLISLGLFFVAAVLGMVVTFLSGWFFFVAGAMGLLVGFFYNGGSLPISHTPVGEFYAGGFLGTVLFLSVYYAYTTSLTVTALAASVPSLLMIASILTVNNNCDRVGDRSAGRCTLAILLGPRVAPFLIYALGTACYAVMVWLSATGVIPRPGMAISGAGWLLSVPLYIRMQRRGYSHETKGASMKGILGVFLLYTFCYVAVLSWGLFDAG